jgi:hypothetical protein
MASAIQLHDHGEAVRAYQKHLNDRLREHGDHQIDVDGDCGPQTILQSALAGWFLGTLDDTVKRIQDGTIPDGVQSIVADPGQRHQDQLDRAKARQGKPFLGLIILASDWGAARATGEISRVGKPNEIIFHHTAGHHPELDQVAGENRAEAMAYARVIQNDHMHRKPQPFIDSGHNFLVSRSGHVLEGRHGSVAAIMDGVMVQSAHCIGHNQQPGIEHEHIGEETMTPAQREASLLLHEFICRNTGIDPHAIHGHREFDNTECPGALKAGLGQFRQDLVRRMAT